MKNLIILIFCTCSLSIFGQSSRLANEYYQSGEYEKAAKVYKKLYEDQGNNHYYFTQYIQCLAASEDYDLAEREIKKQLDQFPQHMQLYVTLGNLKERQFLPEEADAAYQKAISNIPPDIGVISNLGSAFLRLAKYDQALQVYEKGGKLMNNEFIFANNLADLYKRKGDIPNMINYYILAASQNINTLERYKMYFQRSLQTKEDLEEMRKQLYAKIQDDPENLIYPELLEWVFIEKEEFGKALRQARALDRKYDEGGARVKNLADIAYTAGDYDTAIKAYGYLTKDASLNNSYYVEAKRSLLQAKRRKVMANYDYVQEDLDTLQVEYEVFIDEFGINSKTAYLVKEYADFLALYQNDLDAAIEVLNGLVGLSINRYTRADSKISLADYYLMQDEIWESTLLYSQVEKEFKEEYIGEIARFKNAKLSYYAGNFPWAQEQFEILKSATSRLISNDAIDLSVFIMDNMGLDTTDIPLKMFAQAELLTAQNKIDEAFVKLDSINTLYPEHALEDDILYQKAQLHLLLREYDKAESLFRNVFENYPEEIRADNALFNLAELYENQLQNVEEAKVLYEKLFIDFSNSTFAVEARKRYRILRGDNI